MSIKISSSLTLDATEVRVVWDAVVTAYDALNEEDVLALEACRRSFRIDCEADAAEWIEQQRAHLLAKHGAAA